MNDDKKPEVDSETILMTLDQIGQTIDIMTSVVDRLRGYINEHVHGPDENSSETTTQLQFNNEEIPQILH